MKAKAIAAQASGAMILIETGKDGKDRPEGFIYRTSEMTTGPTQLIGSIIAHGGGYWEDPPDIPDAQIERLVKQQKEEQADDDDPSR